MQSVKQSESTAALRRVPVFLVDVTDGLTPETGEAGGQPQYSKNGASWVNTSGVLVAIGNGWYYVELIASELDTLGFLGLRYKSANTAEWPGCVQVVSYDPNDAAALGLSRIDAAVTTRSSLSSADVSTACGTALNTAVPGSPVSDSYAERLKTMDDAYTAARGAKLDNLDAAVTTRASPANVNTEVLDTLSTDTYADFSPAAPTATPTLAEMLRHIYFSWRNRITVTSTERKRYADDTTTAVTKSTVSNDGVTYDRGEWGAP